MSNSIHQAESAIKAGDTKSAFDLLRQTLAEDPDSERAWWIMSGLVQRSERVNCLEQVLRINPENQFARDTLAQLKTDPPKEEIKPEREIPKPAKKAPVTTLPDEFKTWHFTKRSRLHLIILGQKRLIQAQAKTDLVPRIKAAAVKSDRPSFSSGSNRPPATRYPLITTEGLLKFGRVRMMMPFSSSSRVISSRPGRDDCETDNC